jgi:hypothetical protein
MVDDAYPELQPPKVLSAEEAVLAAITDLKRAEDSIPEHVKELAITAAEMCLSDLDIDRSRSHEISKKTAYWKAQAAAKHVLLEELGHRIPSRIRRNHQSASQEEPLNAYEAGRSAHLQENADFLASLGIEETYRFTPILWIQKEHLDKIVTGKKTLEIRPIRTHKRHKIWLAESESQRVRCSVILTDCVGPMSAKGWTQRSAEHCCGPTRRYPNENSKSKENYGWKFTDLDVLAESVQITRLRGCEVWQKHE